VPYVVSDSGAPRDVARSSSRLGAIGRSGHQTPSA